MVDSIGVIRSEQAGIFDLTEKHDIRFRILTNIKRDNYRFVKAVLQKTLPRHFEIEGRHKDLGAKQYPRFVIRDNDEIVFFLTPTEESSALRIKRKQPFGPTAEKSCQHSKSSLKEHGMKQLISE